VIEEDAAADARRRVDVGLEHLRGAALQVERKILAPVVPEPMGEPVRLDGVEALEVEHGLDQPRAGRIAVGHGGDVGAERRDDGGLVLDRLHEGLGDEVVGDDGIAQPPGDPMHHRAFEGRVIEDGRGDEARQRRLLAHGRLGLLAQARPDRIDDAGDRFLAFRSGDVRHGFLLTAVARNLA
jgi:hypothetical protein